jgi:hypothetical protein
MAGDDATREATDRVSERTDYFELCGIACCASGADRSRRRSVDRETLAHAAEDRGRRMRCYDRDRVFPEGAPLGRKDIRWYAVRGRAIGPPWQAKPKFFARPKWKRSVTLFRSSQFRY